MSGALLEILVPTIVIIEDKASVKLLTASKIIAIELAKNPTIALNITKTMLNIIPKILVFIIILFLSIKFSFLFDFILYTLNFIILKIL